MAGILYGIGVGPGDPDLITIKAIKTIRDCDVIAAPDTGKSRSVAFEIAKQAVPEIAQKEFAELAMPMTRDRKRLEKSHQQAADQVIVYLNQGKNVAFLTLGDPSVYSTYMYIHDLVCTAGYQAQMIAGVPSFCAVAAKLGISLTKADQPFYVIPASYRCLDEELDRKATKVLMKSGKAIEQVKNLLLEKKLLPNAKMVQKCGMKGERVFASLEEADNDAGYFSIIVVKGEAE
nr:precorrin-2 C(20)-methyltransferase [uncultured Caproiciproducens sp.]